LNSVCVAMSPNSATCCTSCCTIALRSSSPIESVAAEISF